MAHSLNILRGRPSQPRCLGLKAALSLVGLVGTSVRMNIKWLLVVATLSLLNASAVGQIIPNQGGRPPESAASSIAPPPPATRNLRAGTADARRASAANARIDPQQQEENKEIVAPVVSAFSSKEVCNNYAYQGGKVTDRSVNGEAAVFQVSVSAVNKAFPVPSGTPFTSLCGDPGKLVGSNESFSFEVKAQFVKDAKGWHLQRVLPQ